MGSPYILSKLLTDSGRLRPPEAFRDPETRRQSAFLHSVQDALDAWDTEDRDVEEDFSDEVASLLDEAWGDAPTPAKTRRQGGGVTAAPQRPTDAPLADDWQEDLFAALDRIESAPVSPEQRKILSRDPGQADVNEQLKRGPQSAHADRGTRILKRGDVIGAIAEFSKAIREAPSHPQPWTKRGIARARAGKLEAAIDDYSEALDHDPDYLPALANRAAAHFHVKDYEATDRDCSRALELAPRLAKGWLFRGIARAKLGWGAGAQEDLLRFLQIAPYSPYRTLIRKTLIQCANWDEDEDDDE